MSFLPGMFPGAAAAAYPPAQILFGDYFASETDTNGYNIATDWGTEHTSRHLLLFVRTSNLGLEGDDPDSVAFGGTAATKLFSDGPSLRPVTIWICPKPTGASGTLEIDRGGAGFLAVVGAIWALYNVLEPFDPTDIGVSSIGNPAIGSWNVRRGGVIATHINFTADTSVTWTGVTEAFDDNALAIINMTTSGASALITGSTAAFATQSQLASGANHGHYAAAFR